MQPLSEQLRTRTRDDVLEFAYRRGTRLRRQRLVVRSAVAAVAIAVLLPVAFVVLDGTDGKRSDVQIVDMAPSTTIPAEPDPSTGDVTHGPLGPVPPSGAAAASQAAAPARGLVGDNPVRDQSPAPPAKRQLEGCGPAEVSASTTTDKDSYLPNETVTITARIRNASNHPCLPVSGANLAVDSAGGARRHNDYLPVEGVEVWRAGQTIELVFRWTPCSAAPCSFSQGNHTARVTWKGHDHPSSAASFTVGL